LQAVLNFAVLSRAGRAGSNIRIGAVSTPFALFSLADEFFTTTRRQVHRNCTRSTGTTGKLHLVAKKAVARF